MFSLDNFYLFVFKFTDSFLSCAEFTHEVVEVTLSDTVFFFNVVQLYLMLIGISISLLKLAICILSVFSTRSFNILISVILQVLPATPGIWAIFGPLALSVVAMGLKHRSHLSVFLSPWW